MTTRIIERVRKLLALAGSDNEHEATAAAERAQALLLEHNLSMADLGGPAEDFVETEVYAAGKLLRWRRLLLGGVAEGYGCHVLIVTKAFGEDRRRLVLVGTESSTAVAVSVNAWLVDVVERETQRARAAYVTTGGWGRMLSNITVARPHLNRAQVAAVAAEFCDVLGLEKPAKYAGDFRLGMAARLAARLRARRKTMEREAVEASDSTAVVLASEASRLSAKVDELTGGQSERNMPGVEMTQGTLDGHRRGNHVGLDAQVGGEKVSRPRLQPGNPVG